MLQYSLLENGTGASCLSEAIATMFFRFLHDEFPLAILRSTKIADNKYVVSIQHKCQQPQFVFVWELEP